MLGSFELVSTLLVFFYQNLCGIKFIKLVVSIKQKSSEILKGFDWLVSGCLVFCYSLLGLY